MNELGAKLRALGLVPRALAAWAGTDRLSALYPSRLLDQPITPASVALAMFVAGIELDVDRAARLPLDDLLAAGLVERSRTRVRATLALLPLRSSIIACDRADADETEHLVCWPDDSSYHLLSAIPRGTYGHWHDLACGSAIAMLARPELATTRTATDLNPRAVAFARLGAALSGVALDTAVGDVGGDIGRPDLVTCNAPMPASTTDPADGEPIWQRTSGRFFEALFARREPLIVVHCVRDAIPARLPGERLVATYTMGHPAFSVLWWRPHAPRRAAEVLRPVTADRPHVDLADLDELSG